MADKNAKAELNVEDLEGVAGGKMTQEELLRQGGTDGNRIHKPLITVEVPNAEVPKADITVGGKGIELS